MKTPTDAHATRFPLTTFLIARYRAGYGGADGLARLGKRVGYGVSVLKKLDGGHYRLPPVAMERLARVLSCNPLSFCLRPEAMKRMNDQWRAEQRVACRRKGAGAEGNNTRSVSSSSATSGACADAVAGRNGRGAVK